MQQDITKRFYTPEELDEYPRFDPKKYDRELFEQIEKDRLVVFFGAGVSRLAGLDSWAELAVRIVNKLDECFTYQEQQVLREMSATNPRKAISICYQKARLSPKTLTRYFRAMRSGVTPRKKNKETFIRIHEQLCTLNAIAYVTTNIDEGIQLARERGGILKEPIDLTGWSRGDPSKEIRDGNAFYLHGCKQSIQKCIFTDEHYLEHYQKPHVSKFLNTVFRGDFCVLFVGYSLDEYEILQSMFQAIYGIHGIPKDVTYRHMLLTPVLTRDIPRFNVERLYFDIYSVKTFAYLIDDVGYGRLRNALIRFEEACLLVKPDESLILDELQGSDEFER